MAEYGEETGVTAVSEANHQRLPNIQPNITDLIRQEERENKALRDLNLRAAASQLGVSAKEYSEPYGHEYVMVYARLLQLREAVERAERTPTPPITDREGLDLRARYFPVERLLAAATRMLEDVFTPYPTRVTPLAKQVREQVGEGLANLGLRVVDESQIEGRRQR